ncbi:unnamed protein product, partial [Rotaria sordida]
GPKWLHVYLSSPKALLEQCILLAQQKSFRAIVVTCDHPHKRIQSIHSNHGGRQVDSGLSAIECLKDVVEFVNGHCEGFVDSGIRTGTDVLKCLALGAKG